MEYRVLVAAHNDPYNNPRGGERSVARIIQYLQQRGHEVDVLSRKRGTMTPDQFDSNIFDFVKEYDRVITWADAAPVTAKACLMAGVPYVLMVRWWKNVVPIPPGRLDDQEYGPFQDQKAFMFNNAHATITNNYWAALQVDTFFERMPKVSYVPVEGPPSPSYDPNGQVGVITPDKQLGEWEVINEVAKEHHVLAVNSLKPSNNPNVETTGYTDLEDIWGELKCILLPAYYNDVCGCSRIAFEAAQHGVPVYASDACGFDEWIPKEWLIPLDFPLSAWRNVIGEQSKYEHSRAFELYVKYWEKVPKNLEVFHKALQYDLTKN